MNLPIFVCGDPNASIRIIQPGGQQPPAQGDGASLFGRHSGAARPEMGAKTSPG